MDKIFINGLRFFGYHGVNPEEKEKGQPFELDITMYLPLSLPGETDCVEDTVSYAQALKTIRKVFFEDKYDLLEKVATRIAQNLLEDFTAINKVSVLLKKPRAPISADFNYVAVQITKERSDSI